MSRGRETASKLPSRESRLPGTQSRHHLPVPAHLKFIEVAQAVMFPQGLFITSVQAIAEKRGEYLRTLQPGEEIHQNNTLGIEGADLAGLWIVLHIHQVLDVE